MNAPIRKIDSIQAHRAERGAAAVVAQYVHESSGRHAASRRGDPPAALDSPTARGTEEGETEAGLPAAEPVYSEAA